MDATENERKDQPDRVAASDARDRLTELVDRAKYRGERTLITRNGKPVAAIVSPSDLAKLEGCQAA